MEALLHFSVIIPTRNRQESLVHCISSLAEQSYPVNQFEVIIVDDGSSPPIDLRVLPVPGSLRIRGVRLEGKGAAAARNAGAGCSQGTYLAFTDDDCVLPPDWLVELAQVCAQYPGSAITGKTINRLRENRYAAAAQLLVDYLYAYYNAAPHRARFLTSNNLAVPASAFQAIGGFHSNFASAGGEDREFCDRWLSKNYSLVYSPEVIVFHTHTMALFGFVRQQFNYGKGAFHFNRLRSLRNGSHFSLEPPAFYLRLFQYPYKTQKSLKAHKLVLLFALSQVVNFTGFLLEAFADLLRSGD